MALRCLCTVAPWQQHQQPQLHKQQQFTLRSSIAAKKLRLHCSKQLSAERTSFTNAVAKPQNLMEQEEDDEDDSFQVETSDGELQEDETFTEEDSKDEDDEEVDVDTLSNEEIDALMKEYGDVVRSDPNPSSRPAAKDDAAADAEGLAFAIALAEVANESKAVDIKVLHVKPLVYWTRYFIVASVFSMPQANAITGKMEDLAEKSFNTINRGNSKASAWTLLDFGDVVVHMFLPAEREHYNIEEFYANAPLVDLPFGTTA